VLNVAFSSQLLATGADLVLVSAHKYLMSPTAGLVIGRHNLVEAVRAQQKGIGRAMKPSKEAIIGVLTAIDERQQLDLPKWRETEDRKVLAFIDRAGKINGLAARSERDPAGMPFSRVYLTVDGARARLGANALADALRSGAPSIWVMEHRLPHSELVFELVQVSESELETILIRLADLLD
jgi:seryl-tRNA(Sec) selenium transferase